MATRETLLDTCCILNLCAVDDPQIVLSQFPFQFYVSGSVEREEISIRPGPNAARHERRKIDLTPCFLSGLLNRCVPETAPERNLYVQLAIDVDDGEAMSIGIAAIRKWSVATDDEAARKIASNLGLRIYSTPQLVRIWAEATNAADHQIGSAIKRIETLAKYVPNDRTPDIAWWVKHRET